MRSADAVADIPFAALGTVGDYLTACLTQRLRPVTVLQKWTRLTTTQRQLGTHLEHATRDDVRSWWQRTCRHRSTTTGRMLADTTVGTYLAHLRAYYSWALDEGVCIVDPTRGIKAPKRRRGTPRDVDVPTVVAAIAAMDRGPLRYACSLALWCGLRRAELVTVAPSRHLIARDGGDVLVVCGKGGVTRHTPVPAWLAAELRTLPDGWLLPSVRSKSGHWTDDHLGDVAAAALREHGCDATLHRLRHTFGTAAYARTRDVAAVREVMGHASISTTGGYVRGSAAAVVAIVDDLLGGAPQSPA